MTWYNPTRGGRGTTPNDVARGLLKSIGFQPWPLPAGALPPAWSMRIAWCVLYSKTGHLSNRMLRTFAKRLITEPELMKAYDAHARLSPANIEIRRELAWIRSQMAPVDPKLSPEAARELRAAERRGQVRKRAEDVVSKLAGVEAKLARLERRRAKLAAKVAYYRRKGVIGDDEE